MKIIYDIDSNLFKTKQEDDYLESLKEVITESGHSYHVIDMKSLIDDYTPDNNYIHFPWGSHWFIRQIESLYKFYECRYYVDRTMENYKVSTFTNYYDKFMLNDSNDLLFQPYWQFKKEWQENRDYVLMEDLFIRPDSGSKSFAGQVISNDVNNAHDTYEQFINTRDQIDKINPQEIIVTASVKDIQKEWRLFVSNGKVITGSTYSHIDDPEQISNKDLDKIKPYMENILLDGWQPDPTFMMDIGLVYIPETDDYQYRIIEFNATNTSYWYRLNPSMMIEELNKVILDSF